jgi:hypothetical protein
MQTLKGKWIGSRSLKAGPSFTLGAFSASWRNRFIQEEVSMKPKQVCSIFSVETPGVPLKVATPA